MTAEAQAIEALAHQVRTDAILSAATGDQEAADYQHAFADELLEPQD
ncbi:hypothetical protein [Streptomyces sp. PU_AKi4]